MTMTTGSQPTSLTQSPIIELRDQWAALPDEDRLDNFKKLPLSEAQDFFLSLKTAEQAALLADLPEKERGLWVRLLPPDDLADLIQEVSDELRHAILQYLDGTTRTEVTALLAYGEDEAGGLMNPRFARIRPDMTVDEAIKYLRHQAPHVETTRYVYVLDSMQQLLGVCSLRHLFVAEGRTFVRDVMRTNVITAADTMSQDEIATLFSKTALNALPIVDVEGRIKGIVTVDDIVQVVEEEATEDIQRLGGSEVLDAPYLEIGLLRMIKKRAGWLVILFIGEMLTATAMGYFEREIERAIVLALFIPLIISSGGNSGSQASTLVVRAIALREVRLRDWWRVFSRELIVGISLGAILGSIGLLRILLWPSRNSLYGEHFLLVGLTVASSLVGVVLWGSLSGSMLPFILKKLRLDPATASAPFVATLVDVSGLVIYFSLASLILKGTLL
jgi:magnesium transporter